MPPVSVIFYQEDNGRVPALDWLDSLPDKAQDKCFVKIKRLSELGYALRRPEADLLRDKIYELRIGLQGIHYRLLYFFHGTDVVVISHGLMKEKAVPPIEIERAIQRKEKFTSNPNRYTYNEDDDHDDAET